MKEFSYTQSRIITEASMDISNCRAAVERLDGELSIAQKNLKIAAQNLEFAYDTLEEKTKDESPLKNKLIAEASMEVSRCRVHVESMENDLDIAKENSKHARQNLMRACNTLNEVTMDAVCGKEPLPNLFSINGSNGEAASDPAGSPLSNHALAAHYRESGEERVIAHRPKGRGAVKESQESAS